MLDMKQVIKHFLIIMLSVVVQSQYTRIRNMFQRENKERLIQLLSP